MKNYKKITKCRICLNPKPKKFFSLGQMPSVNNFLTAYQLTGKEPKYPLNVCFCQKCGLVQLAEVVNPKVMFKNYLYISSFSKTMLSHFSQLAKKIVKKFNLTKKSLVVEMGSNDGTFLSFVKKQGIRILGVDPASNLAKIANSKGLTTIDNFFTEKNAAKILKKYGKADVIVGTNVFAHINDLHDVVKGIQKILKDEGVFIVEFPYLVDLLEKNEFDTIYHEHLSYFSLKPLDILFKQFDLELFDAEKIPVHGGSMRIYVKRINSDRKISPRLKKMLAEETRKNIQKIDTYKEFANKAKKIKIDLVATLKNLNKQNKKVIGFGAPAKGVILLNYCKIGLKYLEYITDNIPYKQGLYMPGNHIPIFPEEKNKEEKIDYILILPWNFSKEILKKLSRFRKKGGKIIIPIPSVKIL